ncbi:MAG: Poly-beta-1,6-N-acetyl-D-glucosamine synthase [Pelotomaculum sp. PtaB.Bin013]|uniref:Glycosyltransferase n=1 Tax=Pelotomaculum isophthalicicum JI TaxID=947010 RepID=A0A9X4GY74_9FIRM|nr:glycosyltransferase [Pelotomaculum isophthalicicum]MDF9407507.1 glycosyltransferase [Pelotomaculum isophthalicicum JI]OPX82299.1 MAG: Poly-beta-1,6-N-acetyl-D-glucosamine synthase [Pelotomaculum sp. PtaB.Bin013]OPY59659.1 MAG: Poly-beta-1,6-N-acetyl-D-glucosamine synthase [Pelotomaculum sp. PtaU1.Bin065]
MSTINENYQMEASIIIPCKNEGSNVKMTVDSILAAASSDDYEIIIVDDGSADGCCLFLQENRVYQKVKHIHTPGLGAARARNLGASDAHGKFLIFCDAHITVPENWPRILLDTFLQHPEADAVSPAVGSLDKPAAAGYGQTWNNRLETVWLPSPTNLEITTVPLLPGGCLAVRAETFRQVGGFDSGFIVWGYEDVEISLKLWLFGYRLYVNPSVKILHLFRNKHPYSVTFDHVHYNLLRMAYSHFNFNRIGKTLELVQFKTRLKKITRRVLQDGAMEQRRAFFARRKFDDDWFMHRFKIDF